MRNTRFAYLYRDAENFKQHADIVFAGDADESDIALIASKLHEGECFLPADVGLPELQGRFGVGVDNSVDHVWHETVPSDDVAPTDDEPTTTETWDAFVQRWKRLDGWDEHAAQDRLHDRTHA